MAHRAFVAFSGGGAKGVVHVGALKALEERGVRFVGLSGTSAGAIVATLAAADFRADELIDSATGRTILDQLNRIDPKLRRATDLFGRTGWLRVRLFRAAMRQSLPAPLALALLSLTPAMFGVAVALIVSDYKLLKGLLGWVVLGGVVWYAYRSVLGGLADVRRFRDALSQLLQQKMFPAEPGRIVTMADFGIAGRPALKVVSANLSRRRLHLFSKERTPDTAAADAVAASICLPVIFAPWMIKGELHCDGGIVSNLPAWPFDEERELDPEALTIAVEIEETTRRGKLDRFSWLPAAVQTTLFGSGELNVRIAGPAEQLALSTRFGLLDFDVGAGAAAREVRDVTAAAGLRLDRRLFRLPEIYRNACQVAQALAVDGLDLSPGGRGGAHRVRVAVGRLERGYVQSLRLSHSVGFEDDTDESMLLPLTGTVAGAAWAERVSRLETYPLGSERDLPGPANRLRRKARWAGLAWVMCIPVLDDVTGEPRFLVQLDGNSPLIPNDDTSAALGSVEEAV